VCVTSLVSMASLAHRPALAESKPSAPAETMTPEGPAGTDEFGHAMVMVDGHKLFAIHGVGTLSAAERARNIENRITAAAADPGVSPESLRVVETDLGAQVVVGDVPLVMALDSDARANRITRTQLAQSHLTQIRTAIDNYRRERTADSLIR